MSGLNYTSKMPDDPGDGEVPRSPSKAAPNRHEQPSSPLWFLVVVCGAANAACSARVQWSAAVTVEELRRRCERATGQRRSDYLLVESTRKPMRDHLLVQDYGLNRSQRVRLVTDGGGRRLRGGARGALAEADVDVLLLLLDAIEGLGKLKGWKGGLFRPGLKKHRDASKCEGVWLDADGRVIMLEIAGRGLSGAVRDPPFPPTRPRVSPPSPPHTCRCAAP